MGAVVLSVLAFIGKSLLCLLLILLVLLLVILFVPIRYSISGSKDNEQMQIAARVTWLLKIVRFQFLFPEPGKPALYLLFWNVLNRKPKKESKKKNKKKDKPKQVSVEEQSDTQTLIEESTAQSEFPANAPISSEEEESKPEESKKSVFEKIKEIPDKLLAIKEKILQTENKIETLQQTAIYYWDLLNEPDTKALFKKVFPALLKALKQILPRTVHVKAIVGTGEPDTTAQIYGITECVLQYINFDVEIIPDVNEKRIEGEFLIKGRLYIFVFVVEAIKLLINKRLWKLIKKLKAGRKK